MVQWWREKLPLKGKIIIAVLILVMAVGGGAVAYKFYDFTQNNPKFCVACHLMQPAYDAWSVSEHAGINCHECHHLTIPEQNQLLISFVLHRPERVPPRHGKIIVSWKYCVKCHWEREKGFENAPLINDSTMHAKHYFSEQIECAKCHGYIVHKFTPEARFCVRCHEGKEVHGAGMKELACLNCHTDRTPTLLPGRGKCLYCHGGPKVRENLKAGETLDVTHYQPSQETIKRAIKINVPKGAPMRFSCFLCHKPHGKLRPEQGHCLNCHERIPDVGKHGLHIKVVGMVCTQCHKPHGWAVTKQQAKKTCTQCHEYRNPMDFIKG
ncbi:MAG: cytochrome c3 family protein [Nitrospirota bacterium]